MNGYLSVDIETTGIHNNAHVLQIAAVYDDLKSPISELLKFDVAVKYTVMTHCEPYAMGMNAKLLEKLMDKDYGLDPKFASSSFISFLNKVHEHIGHKDEKGRATKIVFAGKNVASFDIPKIRTFLTENDRHAFDSIIHYKTLDVGSLYYDVFKDNVSLSKINELTNRPAVSHNALDDAFDVVYAVRHKLGIK